MVAQHYRWDFYGLSTDAKPDATNPKVANGSTYYEADTSKLYVWYNDQWYEKEAGGSYELPVASAETLGGVKVGEGLAIDEGGILSASGGGGGGVTILTSDDYDYPADNPDGVATWLLPPGVYITSWGTHFYFSKTNKWNYNPGYIILSFAQNSEDGTEKRMVFFGGTTSSSCYIQDTVAGADGGKYHFTVAS